MSTLGPARTKLQRAGDARAREVMRELASAVRDARTAAGMSQRALARAAGVSHATVSALEEERVEPSIPVLARVIAVLGGALHAYFRAGAGPLVRDHTQLAMLEALRSAAAAYWRLRLEVPVHVPVRGFIDAVLSDATSQVAVEAHSQLRGIEHILRWSNAKADALRAASPDANREVSQLLLVRSTDANRAVVATYANLLRVSYPGSTRAAYAAIRDGAPWPGSTLLWCRVDRECAELLEHPPRGIRLGRG